MISCDEGKLNVQGRGVQLLAELACISRGLCVVISEKLDIDRVKAAVLVAEALRTGLSDSIETEGMYNMDGN